MCGFLCDRFLFAVGVNGVPKRDWCALSGGCQNNGICYNQCDDFWCECPNRETFDQYGKKCEYKPL